MSLMARRAQAACAVGALPLGAIIGWGAHAGLAAALRGPILLGLAATTAALAYYAVRMVRRAEAALARTDDAFHTLADNIPNLCWMADPDGSIFWFNARWYAYTGTTPDQMRGWGWQSVHDPAVLPGVLARWKTSLQDGKAVEITFPLRGADGNFRQFLTRVVPVRNADGQIIRWFGANTDVTDTILHEEARLRSEARFRAAAETVPGMLFIATSAAENLYVNSGYITYTGRAAEDLLGRNWAEVVHPDDTGPMMLAFNEGVGRGTPVTVDGRFRRYDGAWRWHSVRATPLPDADGTAGQWVGICLDIDDRAVLADELRIANQRFELAIRSAPITLAWHDLQLRYTWIYNPLLGRTAPEIVGKTDAELFERPDEVAMLVALKQEVLRTGNVRRQEITVHRLGVARHYDLLLEPLHGAAGQLIGLTCASIDITSRKQIEADLQILTQELEKRVQSEVAAREAAQARAAHAERMQALGQLAGGIAHDLNNVLQAVQGAALLIERRARGADEIKRLTQMMLEATERGAAVTRRLLSFARQGDLRATAIDPVALLNGLMDILSHALGADVNMCVEAAADLPLLLADKGQLETVLVNLATNARDAMPRGGRLTIGAEAFAAPDVAAHAGDLAAGAYIRLRVTDTGTGMDAATLARAMEPFFTTKPAGKGTGLGLAMARGFAQQSGGTLLVESALGVGTTVFLWLPQANAAALPATPANGPEESASPMGQILLVDDEAMVRDTLAEQLEEAGFAVLRAATAGEALNYLDADRSINMLVSDMTMPGGMDGIALVREAQARRPGLPAILLTGFAGDGTGTELALTGLLGDSFSLLRKPVSGMVLADRMQVMLASRERVTQ
jgi:PAS domain S-box-containing protein